MAIRKFSVNDKTIITGRVPDYLSVYMRANRARTIVSIEYSFELQAELYYLGSNKSEISDEISGYPFRSYQLSLFKPKKSLGRPKSHRRYRKKASGDSKRLPCIMVTN